MAGTARFPAPVWSSRSWAAQDGQRIVAPSGPSAPAHRVCKSTECWAGYELSYTCLRLIGARLYNTAPTTSPSCHHLPPPRTSSR
eukprot:scaffold3942_cov123-Isochrysis_galbana.AAC.13